MRRLVGVTFLLLVIMFTGCSIGSSVSQQPNASLEIPKLVPTFTEQPTMLPSATKQPTVAPSPAPPSFEIPIPPAGYLYHGVYPGGIDGGESDLTLADKLSYEQAAGKKVVWVYFSHNWYEGSEFPIQTVEWIRADGSIPYIRLMMRSTSEQDIAEPEYNLQSILDGKFDQELENWCKTARDFNSPLLAEFGTEMNGEWFSWNGVWNSAGELKGYGDVTFPDGPERFRDVYRKIIQTCRDQGAKNITWVFHLNGGDWPEAKWNRFENYYPGDEYIDWIAVSNYGAQTPEEDYWEEFRVGMDAIYPRVEALANGKPIILAEFGVTKNNPLGDQAEWARNALEDILSFRYPGLIGFSWWNEYWQNDDIQAHDTTMRLQDNPQLEAVFKELVGQNPIVLSTVE
jgi:hypothetical protein